jgi:hypothetical protein
LSSRSTSRARSRRTTARSRRSSVRRCSLSAARSPPSDRPSPGNCWRQLPLNERAFWEKQAAEAKALHKQTYPDYKFRPIHTKHKDRAAQKKDKHVLSPEEERRLEDVAQLLIEGKRGTELSNAVRELDEERALEGSASPAPLPPLSPPPPSNGPYQRQQRFHRRSSSVPPPAQYMHHHHGHHHFQPQPQPPQQPHFFALAAPQPAQPQAIAIPALPFLTPLSRPGSPPVGNISRTITGARRPSSVQPIPSRPWGYDYDYEFEQQGGAYAPYAYEHPTADLTMAGAPTWIQRSPSPLPEADTTMWDQNFLGSGGFALSPPLAHAHPAVDAGAFSVHGLVESLNPSCAGAAPAAYTLDDAISPLDSGAARDQPGLTIRIPYAAGEADAPSAWPHSEPSTAYSGSPAPSDHAPLHHARAAEFVAPGVLHAPVPQQPVGATKFAGWGDFAGAEAQALDAAGLESYAVGVEHLGLHMDDGGALFDGVYDASAYVDVLGAVDEASPTPPAGHGYDF